MDKAALYRKQCATLRKQSKGAFNGSIAFVPRDFVCWNCKKDVLSNKERLEDADKGVLITGCPFCHTSFCE